MKNKKRITGMEIFASLLLEPLSVEGGTKPKFSMAKLVAS